MRCNALRELRLRLRPAPTVRCCLWEGGEAPECEVTPIRKLRLRLRPAPTVRCCLWEGGEAPECDVTPFASSACGCALFAVGRGEAPECDVTPFASSACGCARLLRCGAACGKGVKLPNAM